MLQYGILFLFPALMAFSAASDLVTMTISNKVSLLLIAAFIVLAVVSGMPLQEIGWHLLAGIAVLAVTFSLFALGWIGGGDAKLAAATAIWMGFGHLLEYVLVSTLLGGLLTVAMLSMRQYPWPAVVDSVPWIARLYRLDKGIPYGIALGLAGLILYPSTTIWQRMIA
ncbi:MAG: prepilin peptidase [Beijerinckiaceae bacterium]|nr:prepilin peptidase [Beijerinckiaceae bacterium]